MHLPPDLGDALRSELAGRHAAREAALAASRAAIRHAANAIRAMHRGERERAQDLLAEARAAHSAGVEACADQPAVAHAGFLADAGKEVAEAATFVAIVTGSPLPGPADLGLDGAAYVNGLAEAIGELRRHLLDVLRTAGEDDEDVLARGEEILGAMDEIHALLVTIDLPDGVTGGLRRSTDVARSIIERTRGDLTTALVQGRLRAALVQHRRDVLGA